MLNLIFLEISDMTVILMWTVSTILSVSLAVGITLYRNRREDNLRKENEKFFVIQIKNNLKKMAQYFLDVEKETIQNEEYETTNENMMSSLRSYYTRHEQEMKDILYQTKLYLPFWTNLSTDDKKTINNILDMFSWLLYEYYQSTLPESLREITVLNSRKALFDKKISTIKNTHQILGSYIQ